MRVAHIFVAFVLCSISTSTFGSEATGWDKVGIKAGVAVERKVMPDSPLFAFRGEGVWRDFAPILRPYCVNSEYLNPV